MFITYYKSPLGTVEIRATEKGVTTICFVTERKEQTKENVHHPHLRQCVAELDEYFAGQRMTFDVPMDVQGTDFQQKVWQQLLQIPAGETRSYLQIAQALDKPKASRAIGSACGRNKIWLVIPCHRVVGSNGRLTGYAGGVDKKRWLLLHEQKYFLQEQEDAQLGGLFGNK